MQAEAITRHDLEQAMPLRGLTDLSEVKSAMLERNGAISLQMQAQRAKPAPPVMTSPPSIRPPAS
jgi:uncharacterized membrane protein YcaP (DUF421 family)